MGYDDRREIFERLEALERMMRSRAGEHGDRGDRGGGQHGWHHRRHRRHRDGDGDFDEKRVIDTIVTLVGERVERLLDEHQARAASSGDGGGEKRVVDLVVGLVAEHVREIVAGELDRRFGKGPLAPAGPDTEPR